MENGNNIRSVFARNQRARYRQIKGVALKSKI